MAVFPAPALILPRRFTSQPQGPVGIDYSNPVCRDLVFAVEGSQGTRDLVKPDFGSFKPTAPMPSGMAQVFGAASPSIYSARQDLAGATAATWQVLFKMSVLGAEIFEQWTGTQRWLVQTPGSIIWVAAQDNAGNRRRWDVTGTQFVVDYWYSLILSWRGGSDASVLLNGTFKTLSSVNAVATAIGTGLPAVRVGSITTTGGSVALARAWRRGLSESEMLSLHANPWQIFKPPSTVKTFLAAPRAPVSNKQSYPLATGSFTKTPSAPFLNVRRKTRTSQPQSPVGIDWGNPITRGLVFAVNSASETTEILSKLPTTKNSGFAKLLGSAGVGINGAAPSGGLTFSIPAAIRPSTAMTMMVVGFSNTLINNTNVQPTLIGTLNSPGTGYGTGIYQDAFSAGAGVFISFRDNLGTSNSLVVADVLKASSPFAIASTYRSNAQHIAYANGRSIASVATGSSTLDWSTYGSTMNIATRGTDVGNFSITGSFIWNRALSDAEIASISANPWQIFQPDNKPIYVEAP